MFFRDYLKQFMGQKCYWSSDRTLSFDNQNPDQPQYTLIAVDEDFLVIEAIEQYIAEPAAKWAVPLARISVIS